MNLEAIKVGTEQDVNSQVGVVLKGDGEAISTPLGTMYVDRMFWCKLDADTTKGQIFENVDLDLFHQEQGDKGITFLTAKIESPE